MKTRAASLAILASGLLFIALASIAAGASASVSIAGFAFDPPTVTINAGESVTWTNRDSAQHSAAFVNGGPRTRALSKDQSASLQLATAGTFNYVCGIHGASMSGTVIVRAAATPPTVAPTPVPSPVPTPVPTATPTIEPTPSPAPATTATPTPSATASPTVAAVTPTQPAPAAATSNEGGGPSPLVIGIAAIAAIGIVALAIARIRR